jgi:hypothetical protein
MLMIKNSFLLPIFILALTVSLLSPTFGQRATRPKNPTKDLSRFTIEAGGYLANIKSNIRLGGEELGLGLDINFEQALGLETTALTYYGLFQYRFSKSRKHAVKARYFEITRKAGKVLQTDVELLGRVFTVGTEFATTFTLRVINADYSFAFLQDDRVSIRGSFGFFIMPMRFNFRAGDNQETVSDLVAPLPALGLDSYILLSDKFFLNQGVHFFYLRIGEVEGRMTDLYISLEYKPVPKLGLGVGYNSFGIDIQQDNAKRGIFGELVGNVGYKQSGVVFFASFRF